jgi:hypothetical protein
VQLCLRGFIDLEEIRGKKKHNTLLRLVDREVGARGLVRLMMWRVHLHKRLRPGPDAVSTSSASI